MFFFFNILFFFTSGYANYPIDSFSSQLIPKNNFKKNIALQNTYSTGTLVASNLPLDLELSLYKWNFFDSNTLKHIKALNKLEALRLNKDFINFKVLYHLSKPLAKCTYELPFYNYIKYLGLSQFNEEMVLLKFYRKKLLLQKSLEEKNYFEAIHLFSLLLYEFDLRTSMITGLNIVRQMKKDGILKESYLFYKLLLEILDYKTGNFDEKSYIKSLLFTELAEVTHKLGNFNKSLLILKYKHKNDVKIIQKSKLTWEEILNNTKSKQVKIKKFKIYAEQDKESIDYQGILIKWSINPKNILLFKRYLQIYPKTPYKKIILRFLNIK